MTRRGLALCLAHLLLATGAACSAEDAAPPRRPNVLFLVVDDLRPELGCYGADVVSPAIDRLAREGMTFDRAYCQQALCSPSRASVMTGARPDTTRVWDLVTHFRAALPDVVTLGQHFKRNGWFVQGFGKVYHGTLDDPATWSVPWRMTLAPPYALQENVDAYVRHHSGDPDDDEASSRGGPAVECAEGVGGVDVPDDTFHDGQVAQLAIGALRERAAREEPFFLAVGFVRPHLPFVAPRRYFDLYDPAEIELAPNRVRPAGAPDWAVLRGGELRKYAGIPDGSVPEALERELRHGYRAATSYVDAQVGAVLDELERLGLADDTIVVLWGDHGYKLGEHDAWCKTSNVEDDVRVPLVVRVPGMRHAGARTDALVELVDLYPTLCELAGQPLPAHLEGTSFAPLLDDPDRPWKSAAFSQHPRAQEGGLMGYSMRTRDERFTVWVARDDPSRVRAVELYDHRTDPRETVNVAADPDRAQLVAELAERWRKGWRGALPEAATTADRR